MRAAVASCAALATTFEYTPVSQNFNGLEVDGPSHVLLSASGEVAVKRVPFHVFVSRISVCALKSALRATRSRVFSPHGVGIGDKGSNQSSTGKVYTRANTGPFTLLHIKCRKGAQTHKRNIPGNEPNKLTRRETWCSRRWRQRRHRGKHCWGQSLASLRALAADR